MADFTTVQVSELPPSPPTGSSILAHQVGDILSKMTLSELVAFIGSQATSKQYEIKYIRAPNSAYITDNFDMSIVPTQGLGKIGSLWEGWAICNGNNGTDNVDGQALIGWGANYSTVGQFIGSETVALTAGNIPSTGLSISLTGSGADNGDIGDYFVTAPSGNYAPIKNIPLTGGSGTPINKMQPSMVILIIMKL
jgi:hypothetical protein